MRGRLIKGDVRAVRRPPRPHRSTGGQTVLSAGRNEVREEGSISAKMARMDPVMWTAHNARLWLPQQRGVRSPGRNGRSATREQVLTLSAGLCEGLRPCESFFGGLECRNEFNEFLCD